MEGGWLQYMTYTDYGSGPIFCQTEEVEMNRKEQKTFETKKEESTLSLAFDGDGGSARHRAQKA
jgi:hypothetical protein